MQENSEFSTVQYLYTNSISITDQNTLAIIGCDNIHKLLVGMREHSPPMSKGGESFSHEARREGNKEDRAILSVGPRTIMV